MKKLLSLLLAFIMVMSIFTVPTFAVEKDIAEVGAPTQADAVNWLYSVVGKTQGNGQCVALVRAYYSYLGVAPVSGSGSAYATNSLPQSDAGKWERIPYSSSLDVQPGDIIAWSWTNAGGNDGHVAIIVEDNANVLNAKMVTQNPGPPAIQKVSWAGTSIACVIRPKFGNTPTPSFTYTSISTGKYYLKHNATGKYMNVSYGTDANKQNVDLYDGFYTAEVMNIISTSYGYKMRPECCTSRVINAWGDNPSSGANVNIYDDTADSTQSWKFQAVSGGYIIHNAYNTSLVLDNNNGNVCINTYTGGSSQIWSLVPYHTHNYSTHSHYATEHPHYEYLKCSCGATQVNTSKTSYNSSCSSCNLTVNYNANGGSGAPDSQTKKYLSNLTLSSQAPYRDGYAFCGWSTSSTAYEASYFPGQAYSAHSGLTLYAVWKDIDSDTLTAYYGDEWWTEHKYVYYNLPVSWSEAYTICDSLGGHLVTINSSEENDFVLNLAKNYDNNYCWLGGTSFPDASKWYWVTGEDFFYKQWSTSEPNNTSGIESFLEMYVNTGIEGSWNDVANAPASHVVSTGFVCEYDNLYLESATPSKTFTIGSHTYEIFDDNVNWHTAKRFCDSRGGHLVTIDTLSEQAGIYQNIKDAESEEFWLGITDSASEGTWLNVYGNSLTYDNWSSGEPNNDINCEDYAIIKKSNGSWNDMKGFGFNYHSIGFICEYDRDGTTCGDKLSWDYDETTKTLTISGTGTMYDFEYYSLSSRAMAPPWIEYEDEIETVIIEENVTSIGDLAFYSCENIKNIHIPTTITDIYGNAFSGTYIENVYIKDLASYCRIDFHVPNRVSSSPMDGGKAKLYLNNKLITDLVVPDEITKLNDNAFYGCASIESITLHENVESIGRYSFDCPNLKSLKVLNPDCIVAQFFPIYMNKHTSIYGYKGSYAEEYCKIYGGTFIALDEQEDLILGDVDGDGRVTIIDATFIQRHLAEIEIFTEEQLVRADTYKDEKISILDATQIQRFIAQLIPSL